MIQDTRGTDLRRESRDAHINERVRQESGIGRVVEDLIDRIQLRHRPDLGQVHPGKMKRRYIHPSRPGMEIYRVVGVRPEEPVE